MRVSRRTFLATAALSSASFAVGPVSVAQMEQMDHAQHSHLKPGRPSPPRVPAILCRVSKTTGIDEAFNMLATGSDPLEAALHICTTQENDSKDHSTGLGGLPNADGVVQLDACCLHGPTRRVAAVSAVPGICNASLLAHTLMLKTGNALLAGRDAQVFALANGFAKADLTTERTRQNYALWKQLRSDPALLDIGMRDPLWPANGDIRHSLPTSQKDLDDLVRNLEPLALKAGIASETTWREVFDAVTATVQPVCVSVIDAKGQLSCAASSSGQPWRIPGISSDISTIGSGCFLDPEVGSAVSSGSAEANLRIAGASTIVENMRKGMTPQDAGMDVLKRIVHSYNNMDALRFVEMVYYILSKDGTYACVSLWQGDKTGHVRQFTIMDNAFMRRTEDCVYLIASGPLKG